MPAYRPSAVMRLVLRLDEGRASFDLLSKLQPVDPEAQSAIAKPVDADRLSGLSQQAATLNKLSELSGGGDPALIAELQKALAAKRAAQSANAALAGFDQQQPDAIVGFAPGNALTITLGGIPLRSASIDRASFRTMDKAKIELNYFDAPFDPRLLRSAAIEIVMGVVSEVEYDAGIHGLKRADGTYYSVIEDADGVRTETRFLGFVDSWEISFSEGSPIVQCTAQDVMSIIRDTPLPAGVYIDQNKPIEQGVAGLLNAFPALRGIPVTFGIMNPLAQSLAGGFGPVPGFATDPRKRKVNKGKAPRARRMGENTSVWDHITDVCVATGVIPVIRAWGINIQPARTLYGSSAEAPRMLWGRNMEKLSFTRSMSGFKNPTIEVRSYSPRIGRTLAARYPAVPGFETAVIGVKDFPRKPARAGRVPPSGANPDETIRVVTVSGVNDPTRLSAIARGVYEETARQEIEGSFSTRDPSTFGVAFGVADLLALKAGDPIRIEIDPRSALRGDVSDVVTALQGLSTPARAQRLIKLGFAPAVALQFAALLDSASIQTVYRVAGVRLEWDHESGLAVNVDFQNYITIRDDPSNPNAIKADASQSADDATRGVNDATAQGLRESSRERRTADAQGQAGQGTGATSDQRAAERNAAIVNRER